MSPAAMTPQEPVADAGVKELCDVLAQCEAWLALDFPDPESDDTHPLAAAPTLNVEVP